MKKTLWLVLVVILACVLALSACDHGTDQSQNPNTEQSTNQPSDNNDETTDTDNTQTPSTDNTECQHTFGNWETAKQATCNEEGELVRTCSKCSHSEKTTIAKNNVHIEVIDNAIAATCTTEGKTEGKHCSICSTVLVAQQITPMINHTESNWIVVTEATKTEDGFKYTECTTCGKKTKEETIPATGSVGLSYSKQPDGTYAVTGIGSCTDTDIIIPKIYNGSYVTIIDDEAFYYCLTLESVTIPNSVTKINSSAFSRCVALESVLIPDSVTIIEKNAFEQCISLENVDLPHSVTTISSYAFQNCTSLMSINIPANVTIINSYAFKGCSSLMNIIFAEETRLERINLYAFDECTSIKSLYIPASITYIGYAAFHSCTSLENVTFAYDSQLKTLVSHAFASCTALSDITLPDSLETIDYRAFWGCDNLASVTIPSSVMEIDESAFSMCPSLETIKYKGTVLQWSAISLGKNWNYCVPAKEVICSDGTVSLK